MRKRLLASLSLLVALAAAAPAQVLVYDNGPPNAYSGDEMVHWIEAEDFTLSGAQTFNAIRFWSLDTYAAAYTGPVSWFIYADAGGSPGTMLYAGVSAATRTYRAYFTPQVSSYQNDFDADFSLDAGTYWLGLFYGDIANWPGANYAYWETTSANSTSSGWALNLESPDHWQHGPYEHAFQLFGPASTTVPEPTTISLMATGLVLLGARRWRARHRAGAGSLSP